MQTSGIVKENQAHREAAARTRRTSSDTWSRRGVAAIAAALSVGLLTGASCKKDESPVADPGAVVAAADSANKPVSAIDRTPVAGVDVTRLPAARQELFFKMIADLPSPCGKAHSLRTSVTQDQACKRAPFATKLVAELVGDEAPADDIRDFYEARYIKAGEVHTFDLAKAPFDGNPAAAVTLVEFFDYGCAACVQLKPLLDDVLGANRNRIKLAYKMYPLPSHPDSFGAAQAALAAAAQGKFHAMHELIFKKFGAHKKADLRTYAEQVGVDLARYDAELAATEAQVKADMAEGGAQGVTSTPTLFLDGRRYGGPYAPKYFALAIDEAIAVKN